MRNNKEVVESLKQFHKRILETNLSSKIYEQEMMAIIEAIDLLEHPYEGDKEHENDL